MEVEYYLVKKMSKVLIHTTIWINLEIITVSERTRHRKPHSVRFHLQIQREKSVIAKIWEQFQGR